MRSLQTGARRTGRLLPQLCYVLFGLTAQRTNHAWVKGNCPLRGSRGAEPLVLRALRFGRAEVDRGCRGTFVQHTVTEPVDETRVCLIVDVRFDA